MGTRSLAATVRSIVDVTLTNTLEDGTRTASASSHGVDVNDEIENGTGAGEADRAWVMKEYDISDTTNEDWDLHDFAGLDIGAGDGLDGLGQAMALVDIMDIQIYNQGPGELTVSPASTFPWNEIPTHTIQPEGFLHLHNPADPGMVVADGANHLINLAAANGDCTIDVAILGRSA